MNTERLNFTQLIRLRRKLGKFIALAEWEHKMVNLGLSQQIFDHTNNNIKAQIFVILERMGNPFHTT